MEHFIWSSLGNSVHFLYIGEQYIYIHRDRLGETSPLYDRCATCLTPSCFHWIYPLIFSWLMQRGIAFIPSHNSLACKITFFQLFAHMLLEILTSKNACTRGAKVLFKAKILSLRTDALYIFICFIFSSFCVMCLSSNAIFVEKRPVKDNFGFLPVVMINRYDIPNQI